MESITYKNCYGQSVSFGAFAPMFLESLDANSLGTTADTYTPIGTDGQRTNDVLYNPRTIIARLCLIGFSNGRYSEQKMREMWLEIGRTLIPHKQGTLIYENSGGVYQIECRPTSVPAFNKVLTSMGRFKLEFIADNPYWKAKAVFKAKLGQTEGHFIFPLTWPRLYGKWTPEAVIVNDTNLSLPMVIELRSVAEHIKVLNVTTGEFIQVDSSLAENQKMIIDTEKCSVVIQTLDENDGVISEENANYRLTIDSTPNMTLAVGENIIRADNGIVGAAVPAVVTYYRRFLTV